MDRELVDAMRRYLAAGEVMDLNGLDACYDDDFLNLRVDGVGQVVQITKAQLMQRFAGMKAQGATLDPTDDATFPVATRFDDFGVIVMRRVKNDLAVLYAFVWRLHDGKPTTILREFTFEHDLTDLIRIIQGVTSGEAQAA